MNILPGNMRFGAGQPVKRLEDQRLLTGKGQFIDDKPEEGALWLYVLRSPHAHARIKSIDTRAALDMAGVEAVYTGADLVKDDIGTLPTLAIFKRPDGKPMTVPPRRLLAHEIVRYAGEAVAAVVATSRVLAQTAAEAIEIDYEVLPSVVDPVEAVKSGAPAVWPEAPDNIVAAMSYGDAAKVEEAFASAAHTVSLDLVSQRLVPKIGGGRFALLEIMGSNLRTRETIVQGETEGKSFYEIIESSQPFGWRTFDYSAVEAYDQGLISEESALLYCSKRGPVTRAIDNLKKARGESTTQVNGLRMKPSLQMGKQAPANTPPPLPATLKLK